MNRTPEAHLEFILHTHFDTRWGTPYWLEQRESLLFDPCADIRSIGDLEQFEKFPGDILAERPMEYFIPRKFHDQLHRFIQADTGGTVGPPKRTTYIDYEFEAAFVSPFLDAAALIGFPRDVHWLYIGPGGPHIIGKAARACAVAMGSMDPFTVDFDPRWVKRLPMDSTGRHRYVKHVLDQALDILTSQNIGVIFATPPLLEKLGSALSASRRSEIQGIHTGGLAPEPEFWHKLEKEYFPNARIMSGYGNSLAGMCPQVQYDAGQDPAYFPHGNRLFLQITGNVTKGQLYFHRLDESCFLPNVYERDEAALVSLPDQFKESCFQATGISGPRPLAGSINHERTGLY